jgi:hypothetical protein
MLAYYISQSNQFTVRTAPTASITSPEYPIVINPLFRLDLQNMYTNVNYTASLSGSTYNSYESLYSAYYTISGSIVADEYRATLYCSGTIDPIWHGSIQVYASESTDKSVYVNKNDGYISHISDNEFVILD